MNIKEIALKVARKVDPDFQGLPSDRAACEFAEALVESYKVELLKEAGEPVLYAEFAEDGGWLGDASEYADHLEEPHALFTSDQVAAAIIKATKPLEDQLAKAEQLWQVAQGRCDALEEKLAKAEQRVAEWQPIETAPKDGTAVLVMRDIWPGAKSGRAEECNGHNTYVAAWWDGDNAWICYMDAVCDPECPIEPTHWMPLPKAPNGASS